MKHLRLLEDNVDANSATLMSDKSVSTVDRCIVGPCSPIARMILTSSWKVAKIWTGWAACSGLSLAEQSFILHSLKY